MSGFMLGYFFFQAEDGIRDRNVTGVQTCALPIYHPRCGTSFLFVVIIISIVLSVALFTPLEISNVWRSEERRVGRERRERWSPRNEIIKSEGVPGERTIARKRRRDISGVVR